MMKRLACAFAVVSLALTGCSGSVCEDLADSDKSFYDKTKACPDLNDGSPYEEPTESEIQQCETSFEKCTDSDKETISKFIDCINDLPDCTTSTQQQFAASFLACAVPLTSVSDACGAVSSGSVREGLNLVKGR